MLIVRFLVCSAELDQYVFQDSQLEGLSKDIFSKLRGCRAFLPVCMGITIKSEGHPPQGGDNSGFWGLL